MVLVVAKRRFTADVCRVSLDGVQLQFDGNQASRNLPPGKHSMSWHVVGDIGETYEIWFAQPPGIACHPNKTLTGAVSFGSCGFTL
jgi:hypothetical protein